MPTVSIEPVEPLAVDLAPGDRQRQQDVLFGVEHRQQVERLEDEADAIAAQLRERAVVELGQLHATDADGARGRAIEAREQVHAASTCPTPDGPMIAAKRPVGKSTVTPGQRVDGRLALAVATAQVPRLHDRVGAVVGGGAIVFGPWARL